MNASVQRISILLSFLFLVGCVSQTGNPSQIPPTSLPSTSSEAHEMLIRFFDLLNRKQYAQADLLYGGSLETLRYWNPDVDVYDHITLWTKACEQNGLQCLKVRTATFERLEGDTYIFQVEFSNADGSLFVLGPCCGANETEMPPVSQFEYKVTRNSDGKFMVMDLPPYLP